MARAEQPPGMLCTMMHAWYIIITSRGGSASAPAPAAAVGLETSVRCRACGARAESSGTLAWLKHTYYTGRFLMEQSILHSPQCEARTVRDHSSCAELALHSELVFVLFQGLDEVIC